MKKKEHTDTADACYTPKASQLTLDKPQTENLALGLSAGVLYGSWAAFVNSEHGLIPAIVAGLTQGCLSFTITTLLFSLVFWLYKHGSSQFQHSFFAVIGANTITLSSLYVGHWMMGTPDIVESLLPSAVIGLSATIFVVWRLHWRSIRL